MVDDLISRQAVRNEIESFARKHNAYPIAVYDAIGCVLRVPSAEPIITHIIMETLAECGIYGEEATIKLIGTLKRIGMDDLIPPCAR